MGCPSCTGFKKKKEKTAIIYKIYKITPLFFKCTLTEKGKFSVTFIVICLIKLIVKASMQTITITHPSLFSPFHSKKKEESRS